MPDPKGEDLPNGQERPVETQSGVLADFINLRAKISANDWHKYFELNKYVPVLPTLKGCCVEGTAKSTV
ncbi:MAG: hypothetical protein A3C35_01935 [Omnitrophica bacterium RIFCSPHIGHO2_02_FULL_46_11]|nr:MAG: hypothetical protein A3A81_06405 [Omnitrophica bacterium RIFCSPLOWO2_01_FULL_45_10b]OGW85620.1 MAG: hypothetical protein A3C35_01935 [Omnitrophica bacterium RIFCSPHIGHO2_02_FULL_46_11]